MTLHRLSRLGVGALVLALAGCGYALVGRASNLPPEIRKVHLAPLQNRTARAQVEQLLGKALADELVTRQRFAMVPDAGSADAVLSGAIVSFNAVPVSFDDRGRALRYEISIVAQMSFKQRSPEKVLWANDRYLFRENYEVEASESEYFDRELLAIRKVAGKFAETMVTDLLEGF